LHVARKTSEPLRGNNSDLAIRRSFERHGTKKEVGLQDIHIQQMEVAFDFLWKYFNMVRNYLATGNELETAAEE
jgi:hypothetical protein